MPGSHTVRCKRGSGKRWHKNAQQCRTPCQKSHGAGYRRSPKGPHYACIKTKARRLNSSKKSERILNKAKKVYSAGVLVAAMRRLSARNAARNAARAAPTLRRSARLIK